MDSCKISEKDILLIMDVVLEMLQRGELQHGLYNCDGQLLGKGVSVITCCPGCTDTPPSPPSGPDNDTKNTRMVWEVDTQLLSLYDTGNNSVSTNILPDLIDSPPANSGVSIGRYIGQSNNTIMGQPLRWMRITLPDGRVGRIPVYSKPVGGP